MGPLFLAEGVSLGDLRYATRVKLVEQRRRENIAGLVINIFDGLKVYSEEERVRWLEEQKDSTFCHNLI